MESDADRLAMDEVDFAHFAESAPDAIAVIDANGVQWSRRQLLTLSRQVARGLLAAGLREGDVVGIVARNCAEYLAIYMASGQAGFYFVPINWHLAPAEIAYILENSGAKALFTDERLAPRQLEALFVNRAQAICLVVIGHAPNFTPLTEFIAEHSSAEMPPSTVGLVMAYTSATTGRPKGVKLPLGTAKVALRNTIRSHRSLGIEFGGNNVHFCCSMLYHSAPFAGVTTALHMGHCVLLIDHWRAETLLQVIDRYQVTTAFLVPTMFVRLLKLPLAVRNRYSTASLRFVMHSGAPCPIDVKRQMLEWWGPIIWECYGASEGQGTIASPQDWFKYPGTVGRPIPGSRFKIVDEALNDLPPGEVGLVYFIPHTGGQFEYLGDPEKTRASRLGDFITVGDVGHINEEGYVFLSGRKGDLIISAGMNIYAAEIEAVLIQHPAVLDCAVVGVEHELLGEVPHAVVQVALDYDPGPALSADIMAFLLQRVSPTKMPKRITYAAAIPRDPNGKLYKRFLPTDAGGARSSK
jgi:long-chain acyl-CoA synthetase